MKTQHWILALTILALALVLNSNAPAQTPTPTNGRFQIVTAGSLARATYLWDTTNGAVWVVCQAPDGTVEFCAAPVTNFTSTAPPFRAGSDALPMRSASEAEKQSALSEK